MPMNYAYCLESLSNHEQIAHCQPSWSLTWVPLPTPYLGSFKKNNFQTYRLTIYPKWQTKRMSAFKVNTLTSTAVESHRWRVVCSASVFRASFAVLIHFRYMWLMIKLLTHCLGNTSIC